LTSIMSSSGARRLPGPTPKVQRALLGRPRDRSEGALVDHAVKLFRLIGSPGFPIPEPELRDRVLAAVRRSHHPAGSLRQLTAIVADVGRAEEIGAVRVPTLVVHGEDDPLVPLACGADTARRIPGAKLVAVPGMGHDLPAGVVERLLPPLLAHLR
jgi:pimeloyl-ACP methyl ester carboxylesterase